MDERIFLTTSFREKDKVKALGARWDGTAKRWYVPEGQDITPFAAWLTESARLPTSSDQQSKAVGVSLSGLLAGVVEVVSRTFVEGVWTTAEVMRANLNKGNYYLELSERTPGGEVLAQASAVIWARSAQRLISQFRQATGADLDAGIKVLVRVRPTFSPRYGFSLDVDDIDPSYTLGDLEARKREIRERLKQEGLFGRNRALSAPWDFMAVAVIAPERAAGLGDFAKEAQRLQSAGACQFSYFHSRFQGDGAALEMIQAIETSLATWSGPALPDALVIIRGGGSVNDLAWLNDYALARCVCECPVPVLTGIGHERDETSIDEVSHRKFDTPSKVIAGIEDTMRARVQEARSLNEKIRNAARSSTVRARTGSEKHFSDIRSQVKSRVQEARHETQNAIERVRTSAPMEVAGARQSLTTAISRIGTSAGAEVVRVRQQVDAVLPFVIHQAAGVARASGQAVQTIMSGLSDHAFRSLGTASDRSTALLREVVGQGPQKTLRRGFAIVRSSQGKTVTHTTEVANGAEIEIGMSDGVVGATVKYRKKKGEDNFG